MKPGRGRVARIVPLPFPPAPQSDLEASRGEDEVDRHPVLIPHGDQRSATGDRQPAPQARVVPTEVLGALEIVNASGTRESMSPDIADRQAPDRERILIPL